MRRRQFLAGSAAAAAMGGLLRPGSARAAPWGTGPAEAQSALLPAGVRANSILEVFLYGGLAPFESFYCVEEYGRPSDPDYPNQQWHLFADLHQDVFSNTCGVDPGAWLAPFGTDAAGMQVKLGPVAWPLRQRPDILARTRVVVVRHDLEPHEAAIPYMLSGMRLGNVRMAGLGTHVQRYFLEQPGGAARVAPYSYVLTPGNVFSTDNLRAASAVGLHPGSSRPLSLTVTRNSDLSALLSRSHLTAATRGPVDDLLSYYLSAAEARHVDRQGVPLRTRALDDHAYSLGAVQNAPELEGVLGDDLLAAEGGEACGHRETLDYCRVGIRAAASLLRNPVDPARYVNVVDTGLELADGGGGYDTHFEHPYTQAQNGTSALQNLVDHVNAPGEGDPAKIDLDETMVMLTTEFGRTPYRQDPRYAGTNHHPYGFVVLLIGGPIGPDQAGVLGAIGPDAVATDYVTPSELRAAALAALGIYPFTHESFAVGDIRDVGFEIDGLHWLNEHVLGRTV
ncbi:MAG: DUF1501 domain-containing protein [Myxococcota bacterium]